MCNCHTDEVIPHLVQNWLHVLLSQILRSHQAFQHPKHSPETTLFASAGKPHRVHIQYQLKTQKQQVQMKKYNIFSPC